MCSTPTIRPRGRLLRTADWIKRPPPCDWHQQEEYWRPRSHLLPDIESQLLSPESPDPLAVETPLAGRNVRYVSFEDWQAIDQAEVGRGEPHGRPRVKFVRVEEMLETLGERISS